MRDFMFRAIEEVDVILIAKRNLKPKVVRVPADRVKLCRKWFKKYGMPDVRVRHNGMKTNLTVEEYQREYYGNKVKNL